MNYIDFLETISQRAGKIILANFSLGMKKEYKEDFSPVTKTDTEVNKIVIEEVHKYFPTHDIKWEEESDMTNKSEYVWVCDPVDGTIPFSAWLQISTFSLALTYKWEPIAWVIFEPFSDRMILAEKWKWAFLNGEKIKVNEKSTIDETFIFALENYRNSKYNLAKFDQKMTEEMNAKIFRFCSILFAGMMVALWEFDAVVFPWKTPHDWAALKIIVEEAGGKMTDIHGNEQRYDGEIQGYIASNGKLQNDLVKIVSENIIERY